MYAAESLTTTILAVAGARHFLLDARLAKLFLHKEGIALSYPRATCFTECCKRCCLLVFASSISHSFLLAGEKEFQSYEQTVPEGKPITMKPIPVGEFTIGSPASEIGRKADEGPQLQVRLEAFWMSQCEITWGQFGHFLEPPSHPSDPQNVDGVTRPTPIGWHMNILNMGMEDDKPVAGITQYAAKQYCLWLSAETGKYYRLPTEAEWEYACRAGSTGAYHFGEDATQLGEYAWYFNKDDSEFAGDYQYVKQKKPNRWGLYDMHGNVAEWVLDGYEPTAYQRWRNSGKLCTTPWMKPKALYPRVVRGGSWQDDSADLRSAARRPSESSWKEPDPSLPKSRWYHRSGEFVGFRIIRPHANATKTDQERSVT